MDYRTKENPISVRLPISIRYHLDNIAIDAIALGQPYRRNIVIDNVITTDDFLGPPEHATIRHVNYPPSSIVLKIQSPASLANDDTCTECFGIYVPFLETSVHVGVKVCSLPNVYPLRNVLNEND